jgi:UMF1 family MFS transporter
MFSINGLTTLFSFGGIHAAGTFGLSPEMILVLGIILTIAAGIGAFTFGWIDDWIGSRATILIALVGLIASGTLMLLVTSHTSFWSVVWLVGIFVGPVQSAGRSFLAHCAPRDMQNQMFGLFSLSGRVTSFLGPLIAGWVTYLTASQRAGMATVVAFLVLGLGVMFTVPATAATAPARNESLP